MSVHDHICIFLCYVYICIFYAVCMYGLLFYYYFYCIEVLDL